jgi:hypothetical protein
MSLCVSVLLSGCNGKKPPAGGSADSVQSATAPAFAFRRPPYEAGAPELSDEEALGLFRVARLDPLKAREAATLRQVMDLPERLFENHAGYVAVTLYRPGAKPATGVAAGGNLIFSTAGAARNALGAGDAAELARARMRIDLVWNLEPCDARPQLIPGVEGLATVGPQGQMLLPPDRFLGDAAGVKTAEHLRALTQNYVFELARLAGISEEDVRQERMLLGRFRGLPLLQLAPGEAPVRLYRGNVLAETPGAADCRRVGLTAMSWLRSVQKRDGSFAYVYYPYTDTYEEEKYNIVRHAGAAFALFGHARLCGNGRGSDPEAQASFAAGEKALEFIRTATVSDPRSEAAYVDDGGRVKLGAAALTLAALCERERAGGDASHRELMRSLAAFILNQQTPEGEFISHYDPKTGRPQPGFTSLYYPGEALLGLVRLYRLGGGKDARLLQACQLGAAYLIDTQRRTAEANRRAGKPFSQLYPPDAWFMQALEELIAVADRPRPEYRQHLFALADCMLASQLLPAGSDREDAGPATAFPDMVGAIDESDPPSVCATGARGEGLVSALRAARAAGHGEAERAAHYAGRLALAAQFVMQNVYHAHNAYALPSPVRAIGGVRLNPLVCQLRLDYAQHCGTFLLELAEAVGTPPVPGGRR